MENKNRNCQSRILYAAKLPFTNKEEINTFFRQNNISNTTGPLSQVHFHARNVSRHLIDEYFLSNFMFPSCLVFYSSIWFVFLSTVTFSIFLLAWLRNYSCYIYLTSFLSSWWKNRSIFNPSGFSTLKSLCYSIFFLTSSPELLIFWHRTLCQLCRCTHSQITPWFENGIHELASVPLLRVITMVMNSVLSIRVGMILQG